jgi:phenylalanyl-tRNA synthetase alpha chain
VDLSEISKVLNLDELEKIRVKLLGKNGIITQKFKELKN